MYIFTPQYRERGSISNLGKAVFGSEIGMRSLLSDAFRLLCKKAEKQEKGKDHQLYLVLDIRPGIPSQIRVRETVNASEKPLLTYQVAKGGTVVQIAYP